MSDDLTPRGDVRWTNSTSHQETWRKDVGKDPYLLASQDVITSVDGYDFSGFDIPHFHARSKRGELLPQTPFRHFEKSGSASGYKDYYTPAGHHVYSKGGWLEYDSWRLYAYDLEPLITGYSSKYAQEAAGRIYGKGFDALTNLAELASVRRLFTSAARKVARLQFPNNWRKLSNEWLEYRYGWRILIKDILDLNEAIQSLDDKRTRYSQRAGTKWSKTQTGSKTHSLTLSTIKEKWTDVFEVSLRGSVVADIDVPKFQFNPLQTAWELIPYSFVIDWLISVGTALSAMSFMVHVKDFSASKGFKVTAHRTWSYSIDQWNVSGYRGTNSGSGSCMAVLSDRTPCDIHFIPQISVKMSTVKVVDLLGLILQRL